MKLFLSQKCHIWFSLNMTLFAMCINVLVKPEVFRIHINEVSIIPINLKNELLKILCKRGYIDDPYVLKQLINSNVFVMDLSECIVTDDILSCLFVCKYLQKLDLSLRRRQTRYITSGVLYSLFSSIPHLKILVLPHAKEVNDEVIKILSENCKLLKELHIPDSLITDLGLYYIGKNLFYLTVINILGTQISDLGIKYLTSGFLSENLTEINIDKCPNVSSHSSVIIAEKCHNIKIFNCGSQGNNEELAMAMNGIRSRAKQVFWYI